MENQITTGGEQRQGVVNARYVYETLSMMFDPDWQRFNGVAGPREEKFIKWAESLNGFEIKDVIKACAKVIQDASQPPSIAAFIKICKGGGQSDIELEELYRHALTCARKLRYEEPHEWKSAAQRYAITKVGYQNCIQNELRGFKSFKHHYHEGLEKQLAGELPQFAELTYIPKGDETEWSNQRAMNQHHITQIKKLLSDETSDGMPEFKEKVWHETKKRYMEFDKLNEFYEQYGEHPPGTDIY